MPDYVHIDDLKQYTADVIDALMDGVAESRTPNHIVLNPDSIDITVNVLFEQNAVSTQATDSPAITVDRVEDTPAISTETVTDTPAISVDTRTDTPAIKGNDRTNVQGPSIRSSTKVNPSRNTVTRREGGDEVETDRDYEDLG